MWRLPKDTNTYSEHVILIVFPLQQWLRERSTILTLLSITLFLIFIEPEIYTYPQDQGKFVNFTMAETSSYWLLISHYFMNIQTWFYSIISSQSQSASQFFQDRVKRLSSFAFACRSVRLSRDHDALFFFCLFSLVTYGTVSPSIV